jgi:hypothetical protein
MEEAAQTSGLCFWPGKVAPHASKTQRYFRTFSQKGVSKVPQ